MLHPPRRLFIGLLPDKNVQSQIQRHCREWGWPEGMRPTRFGRYHLTLLYLPQPDAQAQLGRKLMEGGADQQERDWRAELAVFIAEIDRALDLLSGFLPEIMALDSAETLTYLHNTISTRRHPVSVPETPAYLDALLVVPDHHRDELCVGESLHHLVMLRVF